MNGEQQIRYRCASGKAGMSNIPNHETAYAMLVFINWAIEHCLFADHGECMVLFRYDILEGTSTGAAWVVIKNKSNRSKLIEL